MRIGFIGLGQMGAGMASNLVRAGHKVMVYNRSAGKTDALVAQGAHAASAVAQACRAEVVMTMLANDEAVEALVLGGGGVVESLARGAIHISSGTIGVALSERLDAAHAQAGQRFIAAPVFGRPDAAGEGKLFVVAAGARDAIDTATPLFEAIGQRTFVCRGKPSAANLVKLSGDYTIGFVIEAMGEAMALVAKGGVDRRQYFEILTSTLFNAPVYKTYGSLIAEEVRARRISAAPLGQKDIRLTLAAAETLRVPMPLASLLRDRLLTLLARGGDALDWSAIGQLAAIDAGEGARQP